jgi:glycosyltransferase involved in cell wall biosynthesis
VPLHNEERWIDECVRSLLAQDYPQDRYEIVVVDNNSTDTSAARVQQYPRVRLFHERQQGDFAARNRGVRESTGEIIAFTDSDTAPLPGWLRAIVDGMESTGASLLVGRLEFGNGAGGLALLAAYEAEKGHFVFSSAIAPLYYGYTCNMAVRREVFEQMGTFAPVFRNADVVLVRKVVDALSPRALSFSDAMRVRRLEVGSVGQYLRKQMAYGRDFVRYARVVDVEVLNLGQRFHVFGQTIRRNDLGPIESAWLLAILAVGALCYDFMRRTGRSPQVVPSGA